MRTLYTLVTRQVWAGSLFPMQGQAPVRSPVFTRAIYVYYIQESIHSGTCTMTTTSVLSVEHSVFGSSRNSISSFGRLKCVRREIHKLRISPPASSLLLHTNTLLTSTSSSTRNHAVSLAKTSNLRRRSPGLDDASSQSYRYSSTSRNPSLRATLGISSSR